QRLSCDEATAGPERLEQSDVRYLLQREHVEEDSDDTSADRIAEEAQGPDRPLHVGQPLDAGERLAYRRDLEASSRPAGEPGAPQEHDARRGDALSITLRVAQFLPARPQHERDGEERERTTVDHADDLELLCAEV